MNNTRRPLPRALALAMAIAMALTLSVSAFASAFTGLECWYYKSVWVSLLSAKQVYNATVTGPVGTTKTELSMTLYEKGIFGYTEVDCCQRYCE